MFSITAVNTTTDLKQAKVYISIFSLNEERKAATFEAIKASAGFVRREISSRMHIRTVPEFTFLMDTRAEYGEKIDKILNEIHKNGNGDENA